MNGRILQIIPAQPGWNVVYKAGTPHPSREESRGIEMTPVACWALFEGEDGKAQVLPMTGGGPSSALVLEDPKKAMSISPPGRRPSDWAPRKRKKRPPAKTLPPRAEPPKPTPPPKPVEPPPEPKPVVSASVSVSTPDAIALDDVLSAQTTSPATEWVKAEPEEQASESGIPGGDVFDSEDELY